MWAAFLDPDFSHSVYVTKIALQLFDCILAAGVPVILPIKARGTLEAAAILHDVGRAEGHHHHHQEIFVPIGDLAKKLRRPDGPRR